MDIRSFFRVKHPGEQFFSHVGMEPPLPGYLLVLGELKVSFSRTLFGGRGVRTLDF